MSEAFPEIPYAYVNIAFLVFVVFEIFEIFEIFGIIYFLFSISPIRSLSCSTLKLTRPPIRRFM